jgi:hypothetical protein
MLHRISIVSLVALALPFTFAAVANAQSLLYAFPGGSGDTGLGWSVAGGGDADGDGTPDVISGAILFDIGGLSNVGQVRVFSGRTGATLHTLVGTAAFQHYGHSVAFVGDLDQDGKSEFVVGTPHDGVNGPNSGSAIVYSGSDASIVHQFIGTASGDYFGYCVAPAGDVNGDGVPDIAVGATQWDGQATTGVGAGYAQIHSGASGALLYKFLGGSAGDFFGSSLASAGDINADGRPDLIVGARLDDTPGADSGSVSIYSGLNGSLLRTHTGVNGEWMGMGVATAGDFNGDSHDDYLVSAPRADAPLSDHGIVRLRSGVDGAILRTFVGGLEDQLGWSLAATGDLNGDGVTDFIFGSPSDATHGYATGGAFVYSGASGQLLYQMNGVEPMDFFGGAVAAAGDVNSDGVPDLIVGAFRDNNPPTLSDPGMVYVFSGTCGPPVAYCTAKTNSQNCTPTIFHTGTTSLSGPDDFFVRASEIVNQKSGLLIWSFQPTEHAFMGGYLCVGFPGTRTPSQSSGGGSGAPDCSGTLAYRFTHNFLLTKKALPGNTVYTQYYSRDPLHPDGTGVSLTAGLRFTVCP